MQEYIVHVAYSTGVEVIVQPGSIFCTQILGAAKVRAANWNSLTVLITDANVCSPGVPSIAFRSAGTFIDS